MRVVVDKQKNETDLWQWSSLDYFVYTDKEKHDLTGEAAYKAAIQEGYFDLIELSYGYHTPLAMQIYQNLTASKHYDLVARIPIHNSYGSGYYWLWSKHAGEARSTENVVREPIEKVDTKASLNEPSGDCLYRYNA